MTTKTEKKQPETELDKELKAVSTPANNKVEKVVYKDNAKFSYLTNGTVIREAMLAADYEAATKKETKQ